jgi:hypothetical protein
MLTKEEKMELKTTCKSNTTDKSKLYILGLRRVTRYLGGALAV